MRSETSSATGGSWTDRGLVIILLASLALILIYIRSLIFFNTPSIIFDASHLLAVLALSVILVRSKLKYGIQVFLVILFLLTLLLIIPLRLPEGVLTSGPDMIYQLQIMQNIAATGTISFNPPTHFALEYAFAPMQETLLVMVGMVLGASGETVLKYAGALFGVLTVPFLVGVYRAYVSKQDALIAVFLATNCFSFLELASTHETLALAFLAAAVYSLIKQGVAWKFLTILFVFAIVSTHEFTSIVSSIFFILAALAIIMLSRWFGLQRGSIESSILKMPALMVTMTGAWLAFVALPFFGTTIGVIGLVIDSLTSGTSRFVFPLTPSQAVPTSWPRIVGDVGIIFFGIACALGFFALLVSRDKTAYRQLLPYATGGGIIFLIGLVSYLRFHQGTDLLSRGFIYVYFFAAPLGFYAILRITSGLRRRPILRMATCICLISIIVLAGVYSQYPRYLTDNSVPLDIEDVRLPLLQWKAAGYFVLEHAGGSVLWGDATAFNFVGGYGEKEVIVLGNDMNVTLAQWISTVPNSGDIVLLGQSMASVPYVNYQVTSQGLHEIFVTHDVIYSSGEVVMVVASGS